MHRGNHFMRHPDRGKRNRAEHNTNGGTMDTIGMTISMTIPLQSVYLPWKAMDCKGISKPQQSKALLCKRVTKVKDWNEDSNPGLKVFTCCIRKSHPIPPDDVTISPDWYQRNVSFPVSRHRKEKKFFLAWNGRTPLLMKAANDVVPNYYKFLSRNLLSFSTISSYARRFTMTPFAVWF